MICKNCGQQIDDNATMCVHCWNKVAPSKKVKPSSKIAKIPVAILAWFSLFVFFVSLSNALHLDELDGFWAIFYLLFAFVVPVIAVVLLFVRNFERKPFYQKWWFWLIGVFLALALIVATTDSPSPKETAVDSTVPSLETITVPDTTVKALTPEDTFIDEFCAASGHSVETAQMMYTLLKNQLLCKDIKFNQKHESGEFSYDVNADGYILVVTADSGKVYGVSCGTYLMYDGENVAYTISDIEVRNTTAYETTYYVIATETLKQYLKAPTTADFSPIYECSMQRNGMLAAVQGYVTSQNSFGAMITSDFVVQFILYDADAWDYDITYVELDGETFGEFIPFD